MGPRQKDITVGGRTPGSVHNAGSFHSVGLQIWFAKVICKIFESEFGSKSGILRGFQKHRTLGGRTSGSYEMMGLQNRVAKKFAKFLHLSQDPSQGS